ncbi:alpha/beta fold hydrolase [Aeromicrobium sp.]|uniref:alpha/beta fold hydrolase n=1 Tax=Aeromicrobium sp. TaxID=1871063 RepID=UPI003D6ADDBB
MDKPEPFVREAGTGPGVVCLHANASSSSQWRGLMEQLSPAFHVLAVDSYDSGKSPQWRSDQVITLDDEVALIQPVLERAGTPLALVGHSYGAAVAFIAALADPNRIRAIAVYEPTLFGLVDARVAPAQRRRRDPACGRRGRRGARCRRPSRGRRAVHRLLDGRRSRGADSTRTSATDRSTAAAHAVSRLLVSALPRVKVVTMDELGHMGPVTHPDQVNPVIQHFLERI